MQLNLKDTTLEKVYAYLKDKITKLDKTILHDCLRKNGFETMPYFLFQEDIGVLQEKDLSFLSITESVHDHLSKHNVGFQLSFNMPTYFIYIESNIDQQEKQNPCIKIIITKISQFNFKSFYRKKVGEIILFEDKKASNRILFYQSLKEKLIPLSINHFTNIFKYLFQEDKTLSIFFEKNYSKNCTTIPLTYNELLLYNYPSELFLNKYKNMKNFIQDYGINLSKLNIFEIYSCYKLYPYLTKKEFYRFHQRLLNQELGLYDNSRFNIINVLTKYYINQAKEQLDKQLIYDCFRLTKKLKQKVEINFPYQNTSFTRYHNKLVEKLMKKKVKKGVKNLISQNSKFISFIQYMKQFQNHFILLQNEKVLFEHGQVQHNCVYSYMAAIQQDYCIIYCYVYNDVIYTVEIAMRRKKIYVRQISSFANQQPEDEEAINYLDSIIKQYNKPKGNFTL